VPELDWFNHSFVQRNRGYFGAVHCNVTPQQHCACGNLLKGHGIEPQRSVNGQCSKPSSYQVAAGNMHHDCANHAQRIGHMPGYSQSIKSHDLYTLSRRFQLDPHASHAAWPTECGALRLMTVILQRNSAFHRTQFRTIDSDNLQQ